VGLDMEKVVSTSLERVLEMEKVWVLLVEERRQLVELAAE